MILERLYNISSRVLCGKVIISAHVYCVLGTVLRALDFVLSEEPFEVERFLL